MPAVVVAGLHAARCLEHLAYRAAAFLRLAQGAAELIRPEEVLRPVVPTKRLVVWFSIHEFFTPIFRRPREGRGPCCSRKPGFPPSRNDSVLFCYWGWNPMSLTSFPYLS